MVNLKLYFLSLFTQGLNQGSKNKVQVVGSASLNLSEYVSVAEQKELELKLPLNPSTNATEFGHVLWVRIFLFPQNAWVCFSTSQIVAVLHTFFLWFLNRADIAELVGAKNCSSCITTCTKINSPSSISTLARRKCPSRKRWALCS